MNDEERERIAICVEAGVEIWRAVEIATCEGRIVRGESVTCDCGAGHKPRLV